MHITLVRIDGLVVSIII